MDDTISRAAAINAICEDGTRLERQGKYTMTMAERKQRDADILDALPSAQQWISCKERLPEKDGEYLVTMLYFGEKTVEVDKFSHYETDDEHNGEPFWMYGYDNVIAWMPRPEAWKGDKHEAE